MVTAQASSLSYEVAAPSQIMAIISLYMFCDDVQLFNLPGWAAIRMSLMHCTLVGECDDQCSMHTQQ
jgi:hypothetical protein